MGSCESLMADEEGSVGHPVERPEGLSEPCEPVDVMVALPKLPQSAEDPQEAPTPTLTAKANLQLKMKQWATFAPNVQLLFLGKLAWDLAEKLDEVQDQKQQQWKDEAQPQEGVWEVVPAARANFTKPEAEATDTAEVAELLAEGIESGPFAEDDVSGSRLDPDIAVCPDPGSELQDKAEDMPYLGCVVGFLADILPFGLAAPRQVGEDSAKDWAQLLALPLGKSFEDAVDVQLCVTEKAQVQQS
ncbi:unnamed protein product [Symbiodinium sp. CCMP2592]|nr:unnamed protein product [Symbiodinium sp. CCMP2592]